VTEHIEFEFRRHSLKDAPGGKRIGPVGMKLAREIGARELRGRGFTHFYASPRWRTHQTLAGFDEGAGDFHRLTNTPPKAPFYSEHPDLRACYPIWHAAEAAGGDMVKVALTAHASIAHWVAELEADLFRTWVCAHQPGDRVLVVGHSPEMELLVYGLLKTQIRQLACGQGFQLRVSPDETVTLI
jgi:phosphohistidine phosphatase SixA